MSDFTQPLTDLFTYGAISTASKLHSIPNRTIQTGSYTSGTTAWVGANTAVYQAVIVPQQVTVTHMGVLVQTAAGNIDVGIYNERGNRLVSSGSTAMSGSTSLQSFDVTDTTLGPGIYWLACACSDASTSRLRGNASAVGSTTAACSRARGVMVEASALPLPATATFAATGNTAYFLPHVVGLLRTTF